ncbi:phosphatidylinositol kinase [Pseudomonas cichorii]|nr:phosphatidylinositol kinase [Pseudomonas cichorii]
MRRIGGEKPDGLATDLFLLGRCTPAPIGNMRIKESAALIDQSARLGFPREEVIALSTEFIDYAYDQGAAIGGASGAGGAAPKILMTQDKNGLLYPDASLPDAEAAEHWFIKFPRGQALNEDIAILRAEYLYYKAIHQIGLNTVPQDGLALHEGRKPSLWMKRFDREISPEGVKRSAVESIYSLAGVSEPGFQMSHLQVIDMLVSIWRYAGQEDEIPDLVSEYLRRDLLNQVLGNTDNHGRNTSIIREKGRFKLAPIYDLAPMSADREGIIRTTRWPKQIELANSVNWEAACMSLGNYAHPARLYERLREDAKLFLHLPELLQPDLPDVIWNHPSIPLANLKDRMQAWGVL